MGKRNIAYLGAILLVISARLANAQQPQKKVYRIGVLRSYSPTAFASRNEAFRQGLHELGYVEGKNIVIEYRYAEGKLDHLPQLAAELLHLKVDVIVTGGNQATLAAKQATNTIPIVAGSAGDLVRLGIVASLSHPGGNVTGSTAISPDLSGKRLEILKEVIPTASKVAVISYRGREASRNREELAKTETAAKALGITIESVQVQLPAEFQDAYATMRKDHAEAVIIIQSGFTFVHSKQLFELAAKSRLPSMCEGSLWTENGCLSSYGPNLPYQYRRAAVFVDKILKGTKPAELPIEQPNKFELTINLKTANQVGLTIPPNVLARADKVIK
jgi:putative tryptophan/tyrosine transport system substrate-binding protein